MADAIPYGSIVRAALKAPPESPIGRETLALLTDALSSKQRVLDDRAMGRVIQWAGISSTDSYRLHKALIKARRVLPEVYDSMNAVASALVKSTDKTVRQLASSTMLAYMLDYPLGKKRLDHHVEFLLSNMGYRHSDGGRRAVCELLCHLARKFPPGVKKRFYDKFVFFAFARAANEESRDVRRQVVDDLLVGGLASPELYGTYLGRFLDIRCAFPSFSFLLFRGGRACCCCGDSRLLLLVSRALEGVRGLRHAPPTTIACSPTIIPPS